MNDLTCRTCTHWHALPRPRDTHSGAIDMGQPQQGSCRAQPPQLIMVPADGGIAMQARFPQLPEAFPACGCHLEREPAPDDAVGGLLLRQARGGAA